MKKSYEGFTTAQVSVGTTATLLAAAADGRDSVIVTNMGTVDVFIGDANVTTSNGALLAGVKGTTLIIPATTALYGRVAAGTQAVSVLASA